MKRTIITAAVTVAALVPSGTAAAQSQGICTWEATLEQSYGLTLSPHESRFHTPEPGTITCKGTFEGRDVDGTGTISFTGYTSDTWCGAGTGYVDVVAELPVARKQKGARRTKKPKTYVMRTRSHWRRVGLVGTVEGMVRGSASSVYRGPFTAQPLDGNCKDEPVKHVTLRSQLLFGV